MTDHDQKGGFILLGGSGEQPYGDAVREVFRSACGGNGRIRVLLVPAASTVPRRISEKYLRTFPPDQGFDVDILDVRSGEEADRPENLSRLAHTDLLMFTGGDQLRLLDILAGTVFLDRMRAGAGNGLVIGGSSAGTMAMGDPAIVRGRPESFPYFGTIQLKTGLGLLDGIIFDTHLVKRGRTGRLIQAVARNTDALGVGIDEDTGVRISGNHIMTVFGHGVVVVVDGRTMEDRSTSTQQEGTPMALGNIRIHLVTPGERFDLSSRRIVPAEPGMAPAVKPLTKQEGQNSDT